MPFQIIRNDITKVKADAIVNTANPNPVVGAGTDSAIYNAAGKEQLLEERKKIGVINRGEVAVTPAFHLSAKYILHTVGPVWEDGKNGELEMLRSCYSKCMAKAVELGAKSIAFPLLSSGVYGVPNDKAIQTAISTITNELMLYDDLTVYLVIFSDASMELVRKIFGTVESHIDSEYVKAVMAAEYALSHMKMPDLQGVSEEDMVYLRRRRERLMQLMGSSENSDIEADLSRTSLQQEATVAGKKAKTTDSIWKSADASKGVLEKKLGNLSKDPFRDKLYELINDSGMTNKEIYTRANLTRSHFSKLMTNKDMLPKKKTIFSLCIALQLDMNQTRDLLERAEWAFNPNNGMDLVVQSFIEHKQYNIYEINIFLMDHGLDILS